MPKHTALISAAADSFATTWDGYVIDELTKHIGYDEADALATLADTLGQHDMAATVMVLWWMNRDPEDDDQAAPMLAGCWLSSDAALGRWDRIAADYAEASTAADMFDAVRRANTAAMRETLA